MKKKNEHPMTLTRILSYCLWIWLVIFTGTFSGCMHVFQKANAPLSPSASSAVQTAFEEALVNYRSGDFEGALARFHALSTTGSSQDISRKAKMGEIYCHIMLAKTQADYQNALDMWREFGRTTKSDGESWAITLTDPLVDRLQPRKAEIKMGDAPSSATISSEGEKQFDMQQPDQESAAKILELTKKAKKTDQLQREMNEIIKENQSLKKKIKALETIDQNIQRKKSEIEIADEQTQ